MRNSREFPGFALRSYFLYYSCRHIVLYELQSSRSPLFLNMRTVSPCTHSAGMYFPWGSWFAIFAICFATHRADILYTSYFVYFSCYTIVSMRFVLFQCRNCSRNLFFCVRSLYPGLYERTLFINCRSNDCARKNSRLSSWYYSSLVNPSFSFIYFFWLFAPLFFSSVRNAWFEFACGDLGISLYVVNPRCRNFLYRVGMPENNTPPTVVARK